MSAVAPARRAALRVLERVVHEDAFADLALDAELERMTLSTRDAALATEIVLGVLRWRRLLDALLLPHSKRALESLDSRVLTLLRMTAYQIVFLDRIPVWAAVNDAVALAKARAKPGPAEFVNAVLRAFARRGPAERRPRLPPDPFEALAVQCSFPTWLAERWVGRYGFDEAEQLMRAMNERPPLTTRVNTLRTDRQTVRARLRDEEGLESTPTRFAPEGLEVSHGRPPDRWRAFADGDLAPQDEASILVTHLLEPPPNGVVADVCAAPGTKTGHIAALMGNRGRVVAFDPQPQRLALVRETARRLGISIIETRNGAVEHVGAPFTGGCDRVLVDAPCSNLGVLRRNPDVKWRRRPEDIPAVARRQRGILAAAAEMLKPGGYLVYATCSLEPEENEVVVREFVAAHPDFARDRPGAFPFPLDPDGSLRCLPHRHGTDGFTAQRLRRLR